MFPTICSLATEGLGDRTPQGSGIMCTAIIGGAIVPFLFGTVADLSGDIRLALAGPLICSSHIARFWLWTASRPAATSGLPQTAGFGAGRQRPPAPLRGSRVRQARRSGHNET